MNAAAVPIRRGWKTVPLGEIAVMLVKLAAPITRPI